MAKKTEKTKERRFEQELPCELTAAEYTTSAEAMAKTLKAIDSVENEKREANERFKQRLGALDLERSRLIEQLETHKILRMVKCVEQIDFQRNRMVVMRLDNGMEVSERAMDIEEREKLAQGELPVVDGPDARA